MAKDIFVDAPDLALDTPRHHMVRGLDITVLGEWQHKLRNAGISARCLPFIEYDMDDEARAEADTTRSEAILSSVGGLVIARGNHILELDRSVLTHIEQAAELGIPIFTDTPLEEVHPTGWKIPPAEVCLMGVGFQVDMIKERLEGAV